MSASEAAVQTAIRIRAGELGVRPWRNNVGACVDETGRLIRYGLANDSAQMQKRLKSSDLVGWVPRQLWTPTREDGKYGRVEDRFTAVHVAVFLSVECKRGDWFKDFADPLTQCRDKFTDREEAQARWIDLVRADGGIAGFARSVAEFEALLKGT